MKKIVTWVLTCVMLMTMVTSIDAGEPEKEVDALITEILAEAEVPGIAVAITTGSTLLFAKGYGVEQVGSDKPMTENSVSGIGSLTKSFTALAMLQQVEKGNVKLDDLIIDYFPQFRTFDKDKSDRITIGMLLNNSSGLPHNQDLSIWEKNDAATDYESTLKQFERVSLAFDPGTSYSYSNDGFMLVGMLLEKITGRKYEDILQENILTPLQMNASTTAIDQVNALGGLYGNMPGINGYKPAKESHLGIMLPAGSEFRSSVIDLSHYAQMMLQGGQYQDETLLGAATFNQYEGEGGIPFEMYGQPLSYHNGWIHLKDTSYVFHLGQTLSMSSVLLMDTQAKIAVSLLYNVSDVFDKQYSTFDTAFKILSLYNGKDLSGYKTHQEPILKENVSFIEDDSKVVGAYQSQTGLMKLSVEENNGLIGHLTTSLGVSDFEMDMVSDEQIYIKNVASEGIMGVIRGARDQVIALIHPFFGRMDLVNETPLTGYSSFNGVGFECQVFNEMTVASGQNENSLELSSAAINLLLTKQDWDNTLFQEPEGIKIVDQTGLRESVINGKTCREKIWVVEDGDTLKAILQIGISENSKYTLTGTMPFEELTEARNTQILELIKSLADQ